MREYDGPERRISTTRELERLIVGQEHIRESIDALASRVGEQNGRVAKLEVRASGYDNSISAVKEAGARIAELERYRWEHGGRAKAVSGLVRDALAMAAIVVSAWSAFHR